MYDVNQPPPQYPVAWKLFKWLLKFFAVVLGFAAFCGMIAWLWVVGTRLAPVIAVVAILVWLCVWADKRAPESPPK